MNTQSDFSLTATQSIALEEAERGLARPASHSWQDPEPGVSANLPAWHFWQLLKPEDALVPTGQISQELLALAPSFSLARPEGHAMQFAADGEPRIGLYEPGKQDRQALLPSSSLYFPESHNEHTLCAGPGANWPREQRAHAA